jgi:uncharacterized protein (TIGR00369 family)
VTEWITPLDEGIGLTLERADAGEAVLRLDVTALAVVPDGEPPFVHGGALATCVDTASWYAAESASPGSWVVSSLSLDCVRPAHAEPHVVRATCRKAGRTLAVADVEIFAASDPARLVALGRATLVRSEG